MPRTSDNGHWILWAHPDLNESLGDLDPSVQASVQRKTEWAQILLACKGRTTVVKGTTGHDVHWRRTPVKGFEYYLWWLRAGTRGAESLTRHGQPEIFLRDIRPHKLNSEPLDPGTREDYTPVDISSLDPRYADQESVVPSTFEPNAMQVKLVTGYPGSGKTISLLFAARDLVPEGNVLYVTYTPRLAREAREFFEAFGLGSSVFVRTLDELETEILTDGPHTGRELSTYTDYREFKDHVRQTWARHHTWIDGTELALWEELRAYLFGMALPFSWRRGSVDIPPCELLNKETYREVFHGKERWSDNNLDRLYCLADQVREKNLCSEQTRARATLNALRSGSLAKKAVWLGNLRALVVDEIQDLTPLQIALLGELARVAASDLGHRRFAFIAAGDESQIVQPSGFEWGITKDLLYQRLRTAASETTLTSQRRSPARLAQLLNNTRPLFDRISRRRQEIQALPDDALDGTLLRCSVERTWDWNSLLTTLAESPGRALVDLDDSLSHLLSEVSGAEALLQEVVYTPQDIKGLDRRTVLVWSLAETIREYERLWREPGLRQLQVRHMVGAIRVALGRATETLVILERSGSQHLEAIGLDEIDGVRVEDFTGLLHELKAEEYSHEERVAGFLQETAEAIDRDNLDRASERLERAESLLQQVDDQYLENRLNRLRQRIRRRVIGPILQEAAGYLSRGEFEKALQANEQAGDTLLPTDPADLKKKVSEQHQKIQRAPIERAMEQAEERLAAGQLDGALEVNSRAESLAEELDDTSLLSRVRDQRARIRRTPVEDALSEVGEHLKRRDFQKALESNERAEHLSAGLSDTSLKSRIQKQRKAIRRSFIESLLHEAEEHFESGDIESAFASAERAEAALTQTDEDSLKERVREQKQMMRLLWGEHLVEETEECLASGELEPAVEKNHQAQALLEASNHSTGLLDEHLSRARDQEARIDRALAARRRVKEILEKAEEFLGEGKLLEAHDTWCEAQQLCLEVYEPDSQRATQEFWKDRDEELKRIANEHWKQGKKSKASKNWSAAADAYGRAADIRRYQAEDPRADATLREAKRSHAKALDCLAERYQQVPPPAQGKEQVVHLIDLISRYVICLKETGTISEPVARGFVEEWVKEAEEGLGHEATPDPSKTGAASALTKRLDSDLHKDYPDLGPKAVQAANELVRVRELGSAMTLVDLLKQHFPSALGDR